MRLQRSILKTAISINTGAPGLTSSEVCRIVADLRAAADVVGLTIAEFFLRQVMHPQQISMSSRYFLSADRTARRGPVHFIRTG